MGATRVVKNRQGLERDVVEKTSVGTRLQFEVTRFTRLRVPGPHGDDLAACGDVGYRIQLCGQTNDYTQRRSPTPGACRISKPALHRAARSLAFSRNVGYDHPARKSALASPVARVIKTDTPMSRAGASTRNTARRAICKWEGNGERAMPRAGLASLC
jgi:hypothetical protein